MRSIRSTALSAIAVAFALAAPAVAQTPGLAPSGSVGSTINGGPPETLRDTTATGVTKPPGDALGPGMGTRPELEKQSRELDKRIDTGICSGCK